MTSLHTRSAAAKNHWLPRIIASRIWILGIAHVILFSASYALAFALRFDLWIPQPYWRSFLVTLPAIVIVKLTVFFASGQLHGWWR
ncbi:MAG: hypothetical protein AAGA03_18255, partial [Planctomycetota bacterium]